jgi:hypothetical protein
MNTVERLANRTDIAIVFGLISETLNQATQILDTNFCGAVDPATGACTQSNFGRRYFNQQPNMTSVLPLDYARLQMFYNAFQASLNKRFANGLNFLAAYNFAKNLGNEDGNVGGSSKMHIDLILNTDL